MNFPVFDLHCDTSYALLGKDKQQAGSLRKNELHIDLERAKTLPGYAQCFACYTSPLVSLPEGMTVVDLLERELICIGREIDRNQDLISLAYSASEIEQNRKNGKMSAILTLEGTAGFGYDLRLLDDLYKIGFRISTLGWNEDNILCGSHLTGGGLTDLGGEYVFEAQQIGILIDVSHISDRAFWEIINMTQAPLIASHSNSRALCNVSRNLTDEMFKAICHTGGVVGLNLCPDFLGEHATLDTACDHILHWLALGGEKHIALGGDLDGIEALPGDFDGVQDYPKLAKRLLERGVSEQTVMDIFWNNAMGVIEKCCM